MMAQEQLPQLFGVIPTSSPCITTPTFAPSPTSFLYHLTPQKPFSHICVFLLPGITLPPHTAAAVYISLPSPPSQYPFKFLGGIGPGKESAIFKISRLSPSTAPGNGSGGGNSEIDMDAPDENPVGDITLGISLESAESVAAQIAALQQTQHSTSPSTSTSNSNSTANASALVTVNRGVGAGKTDTVVLAQRIIKNAFNFLASFSGNLDGGVEVVPLKAFEEWWRKFEGRVRSDPGFLERDGD